MGSGSTGRTNPRRASGRGGRRAARLTWERARRLIWRCWNPCSRVLVEWIGASSSGSAEGDLFRALSPSRIWIGDVLPIVVLLHEVFIGHGGVADHDGFHAGIPPEEGFDPRDLFGAKDIFQSFHSSARRLDS